MANIVTGSRILLSILLLFFPAFSTWFYVIYLICGLTDMVDGTIARKTNAVSEFGSRLDTIADFVFVVVCLVKLLPVMDIPTWLWI
jgi:CDP-diacylglycerol--glycerol-3-phosphate 3-phosphatidyltransferase